MIQAPLNKMLDLGSALTEDLVKLKDGEFLCDWKNRGAVAFELAQANRGVNISIEPHGQAEKRADGTFGFKKAHIVVKAS